MSYNQAVASYKQTVALYRQAVASYKQTVALYKQAVASYKQAVVSYKQAVASYKQTVVSYKQAVCCFSPLFHRYQGIALVRLHWLAVQDPCNRFLGSLNGYKFGLSQNL